MGQAGGGSIDLEKLMAKQSSGTAQLLTAEQMPLDNQVDPDIYKVGPGDVIAYVTTGIEFAEKLTAITAEGSLILERFGILDVKGLTLTEVKQLISEKMAARSAGVEVFLTLRRPRLVYVTLQGNVPFPGTYAVPASMRVSSFITLSRQPWLLRRDGGVAEQIRSVGGIVASSKIAQLSRNISTGLSAYAQRNIVIRRREGVSLVDLPKSEVEGFSSLDPHLREGDLINVPFDAAVPQVVSISGAVTFPTSLAFKSGDRASLLLSAAGSASSDADLEKIVLVQSKGDGKSTIKVDAKFRIIGEDPLLEPGSSIVVERKVIAGGISTQGIVEVYGEVVNPGSVVIVPGTTRLSDVVELSGGITQNAATSLAYVVRPDRVSYTHREEREDAMRKFMYSDLRLDDTTRFHLDQNYRLPYVSSDFTHALQNKSSSDNVVLQNGDVVVVPKMPDRVYVYGQVTNPGYVGFEKGKNLDWYVNRVGGYATGAKSGRARIIKGKTKVWVEDDSGVFVEPGDEVYVPRAPDYPAGVELQTWSVIAGMVSSLAAITATIIVLFRK